MFKFPEAVSEFSRAHDIRPNDRSAKVLLFATLLPTAQYRKAAALYPWALAVVAGGFGFFYLGGLLLLMIKSLKMGTRAAPGILFTLGWFFLFLEGQAAGMLTAGCLLPANTMTVGEIPPLAEPGNGLILLKFLGPAGRSSQFRGLNERFVRKVRKVRKRGMTGEMKSVECGVLNGAEASFGRRAIYARGDVL